MTLTLITPPSSPVVSVEDLKKRLRVDSSDEDDLLAAFEETVVGYIDGWRGVLGRAILPQVWRQEFGSWGSLQLALPDVSAVEVTYLAADGAEQPATEATLRQTASGPVVDACGPAASRIFVDMTCAMADPQLAMAKTLIGLMVGHLLNNREAVSTETMMIVPLSAEALMQSLRWARL